MRVLHYIETCMYYARQSTHHKSRHGALLVRNGTIVSAACNTMYRHAETALGKPRILCDLYIVRVDAKGNLLNSKPCADCVQWLQRLHCIRRVYYSDENGMIRMEKIGELKSTHLSSWQKSRK